MKIGNKIGIAAIALYLTAALGCGGSSADSGNSNSSNKAKANSSASEGPRDMSPVSVTGSELSEKQHKGREVTVSELRLKQISPNSLWLVTASGAQDISCDGEFSSYMSSAKRVDELVAKGISNAPKATIKGIYLEKSGAIRITPCVLVDLER